MMVALSEQADSPAATQIISVIETTVDGTDCIAARIKTLSGGLKYVYELQDGEAVAAFKIIEGHRRKAMKHEFLLVAKELEQRYGYKTVFSEKEGQYKGENQ